MIELRRGTREDLDALASLRGIGNPGRTAGLEEAHRRKLLRFCQYDGHNCWAVLDQTLKCVQLRRMDGGMFTTYDGAEIKAKSLPGSRHAWPLGTELAQEKEYVAIVEGGPDLLAAHQLAYGEGVLDKVAIVGVLGASVNISPAALVAFCDKRIRIFAHNDRAGLESAKRLGLTLNQLGKCDIYDLAGWTRRSDNTKEISDLNDILVDASDNAMQLYRSDPLFGYVR